MFTMLTEGINLEKVESFSHRLLCNQSGCPLLAMRENAGHFFTRPKRMLPPEMPTALDRVRVGRFVHGYQYFNNRPTVY